MHALLKIGDSRVMVNDVMPGYKGPQAFGGSPASLWLYVDNCDAFFNRAVEAGGTIQMPMADHFWGDRGGCVKHPEGYTWWIASNKDVLSPEEINDRAKEFFRQMAGAPRSGYNRQMDDDTTVEHLRLQAEVAELEREHRSLTQQRPPNMADHAEHMRKLRDLHARLESHRRRLRQQR